MPLRDSCPICGATFRAGLLRHIEICADRAYREDEEKAQQERQKRAIENGQRLIGEIVRTKLRSSG